MGAKLECGTACPDSGRRYSIASHDASYTGAKGRGRLLRPLRLLWKKVLLWTTYLQGLRVDDHHVIPTARVLKREPRCASRPLR